jgi:broad specificity phosphatase PhoE
VASIYLIRHGQASFGAENYDQLSPLGCRQAEVTGQYLRDAGIRIDTVYSGDLSRQRETASLAKAQLVDPPPHHIDARFNEIDNDAQIEHLLPAVLERRPELQSLVERGLSSSKDYQKIIEGVFNFWVSPECQHETLQSWEDYSSQVREGLRDLMVNEGAGKSVAVFTSGGTIATLVAQSLGLDGAHTYRFYEPIFNCSVTQLFYSGERVSLSYFNDRSFLQVAGARLGEELVSYR